MEDHGLISERHEGETRIFSISPSSLDRFQSCKLAYYFSKKLHLFPVEKPYPLDRGTFGHLLLELHYNLIKENKPIDEILETVKKEAPALAISFTHLTPEEIDEGLRVYSAYWLNYLNDSWKPLFIEQPFSYVLMDREYPIGRASTEFKRIKVLLEGKMDLVFETPTGEIIPADHKTVEREGQYSILANQVRSYTLVSDSDNLIINEVGYQKTPKFRRIMLSVPREIREEYKTRIIPAWINELLEAERTGDWTPNPSNCKYCNYRMICETTPNARQWKIDTFYKKGEDYDIYQKGKEEKK